MSDAGNQRTIAEHQISFRDLNERIQSAAEGSPLSGRIPFTCECPDPDCLELLSLTFDEYEAIRQHPRRFFNASGHEVSSVEAGAEVVLQIRDDLTIVEKVGIAGELADLAREAES